MNQYKALLLKEWQTHRSSILTPLWFTLGVIVITLLGIIINWAKTGVFMQFDGNMEMLSGIQRNLILWGANRGGISMLGFIGIITGIILSDAMLNGGFKRRCEIFHLSQPVSYMSIVSSKYVMMLGSVIAQVLVIGLLGSLVGTAYLSGVLNVPFQNGLVGLWQGMVEFIFAFVFVSSLFWFFSGVFKRKPFFMAILIFAGIEIARLILNKTAGLAIPSLSAYILKLSTMGTSINIGPREFTNMPNFVDFVGMQWKGIFSIDLLMKSIYSVILYAGGYWFYKRREIS